MSILEQMELWALMNHLALGLAALFAATVFGWFWALVTRCSALMANLLWEGRP